MQACSLSHTYEKEKKCKINNTEGLRGSKDKRSKNDLNPPKRITILQYLLWGKCIKEYRVNASLNPRDKIKDQQYKLTKLNSQNKPLTIKILKSKNNISRHLIYEKKNQQKNKE